MCNEQQFSRRSVLDASGRVSVTERLRAWLSTWREQQRRPASQRGMTLIEIMVVVTVIALMTTAISISVVKLMERAKIGKAKGDIASLSTALDLYYADQGEYPSQGEGLSALTVKGPDGQSFIKGGRLPQDPWKQDYTYRYPGTKNPDGFDVCSTGRDKQEGSEDDICNGDAG